MRSFRNAIKIEMARDLLETDTDLSLFASNVLVMKTTFANAGVPLQRLLWWKNGDGHDIL